MTTANQLRLDAWLGALTSERRDRLGRAIRQRAREGGLVVERPEGPFDIPTSLTPAVAGSETAVTRARDAANVLSAIVKTARSVLSEGLDAPLASVLFRGFGPLERRCLANWQDTESVSISRVDWFVDAAGRHRALELNATIPAMIGYSDVVARAWLETLGEAAGLTAQEIARLVERNGSNREDLRRSLLARARAQGLQAAEPSIVILHREGDPQRPELEACAAHFRENGHHSRLATPDQVRVDGSGEVTVAGERFDILYRHIFARRMEENSDLARIAEGKARQRLQNPINGHLEVKALFALLAQATREGDQALTPLLSDEELDTAARVLPWTHLLTTGSALDPDGDRTANLVERLVAEPQRFVLKRSWDYGGKSVLIGPEVLASEGMDGWSRRVREAGGDEPGSWIAQERIDSPRERRWVVDGAGGVSSTEMFADFSSYTATGPEALPGGSVVRFARGGVVNIAGGGGVAPFLRDEVLEAVVRRIPEAG